MPLSEEIKLTPREQMVIELALSSLEKQLEKVKKDAPRLFEDKGYGSFYGPIQTAREALKS